MRAAVVNEEVQWDRLDTFYVVFLRKKYDTMKLIYTLNEKQKKG